MKTPVLSVMLLVILTQEGGIPLGDILEIAPGGAAHSCALLGNHSVKCWGNSEKWSFGQRSDGRRGKLFSFGCFSSKWREWKFIRIVKLSSENVHNCALKLRAGSKLGTWKARENRQWSR